MNILVTSYKGGTGKTSIALNLAIHLGYRYITNDIVATPHPEIFQIDANKKKIPENLCFEDKAVYDFGAMSTQIDPKINHAERLCDMIIIPCGTDPRSLKAAVDTFTLMSVTGKPVCCMFPKWITTSSRAYRACLAWMATSGLDLVWLADDVRHRQRLNLSQATESSITTFKRNYKSCT